MFIPQSEEIPCSLFDIDPVRVPWRFLAAMFCIAIVALILVEFLPPCWSNLRIGSGIVAGVGMGGMLAPLFKLFRLPRRLVDPDAGLQKFSLRERDAAGIR
ncbi:hypothetical protein [Burkholderia pseudomallei]|uniref:hypothetical protein n=1 Tax=Burkholderia pseudomallei TaxID=28450 RepID=UPI000976CF70|nr:hypothetical protein [Burkholderia pseudomallei]MBM5621904.1 hypothetical protein [Burkholderia pseudomallei]MBM5634733.1 hypothetical protein [Burkholderia pseudomallei]MBM5663129.1 hypothetical protein [Burkholderia pseudomallei]MBM5690964.1 hypothetical protein [Burkholderia pseudomallei]